MIQLDIVSGFLGAGKTTMINKLVVEAWPDERVAILENEFGEVGVDGELLDGPNITVKEIANGCICCSLQGNFVDGLRELAALGPGRIVVEPTGMGSLRQVYQSVKMASAQGVPVEIDAMLTVVHAVMLPAFLEIGGSFFQEQIEDGPVIVVSAVQFLGGGDPTLDEITCGIRALNPDAPLFVEPWGELDVLYLLATAEEQTRRVLASGRLDEGGSGVHDHSHAHEHPHDHEHEEGTFDFLTFLPNRGCAAADFTALLDEMTGQNGTGRFGRILRGKGFVTLDGMPMKLHFLYDRYTLEPAPGRRGDRLVFIGELLEKESLRARLRQLLAC